MPGRRTSGGTCLPDRLRLASGLLAAGAAASFLAVGIALVLQHGFDIRPCPWCTLQRLIFLLLGLSCALGAWLARAGGSRLGAAITALVADAFAAAGIAAALYQQLVAARSDACGFTLADRITMALSLHEIAPWMFLADASCAEASLPLLGLPFAIWSLALFALIGAAAVLAFVLLMRERVSVRARLLR